MLNSSSSFASGLTVRPAGHNDQGFLQSLYRSSRPDLQFIDGEADLKEEILGLQYRVLHQGAGHNYPNAMHFVIEKAASRIGSLIVDFGHNEVRVIFVALIPAARGFGYGKEVLRGVQQAATQVRCPVAVVVWRSNPQAKRVYLELGFRVEESQPLAERLVWYPGDAQTPAARFAAGESVS